MTSLPTTLGEHIDFANGKSSPDRTERGAYPVFGSNGIIGLADVSNSPGGTTIVGRVGSYCGSLHYSKGPCWVTDNAIKATAKQPDEARFWYFALQTLGLHDLRSGSGQPLINQTSLKSVQLRVPPREDRLKVAGLLGALDDKIELNRRMNETLEAMAQAIFRDWFVDFGPSRRKHTGVADPVEVMGGITNDRGLAAEVAAQFPDGLGDHGLPEGWEAKGIDALAEFLNGLALQKFPVTDGAWLPAIKIAQLRTGNTENSDRVSAHLPPQYVVNDGDVLFSWSGSLTHQIWTGGCGALNQHLFKVTSDKYPKWFYYLWLSEHMPTFQAVAASKATTMGHIQRHHLTQAVCAVPLRDVIEILGRTIAPFIDRLTVSKLESRTLAATRDLLLPKLMSGEIRLRDAENAVAEAGA